MEITATPLIACKVVGRWEPDELPGPMTLLIGDPAHQHALTGATLIRSLGPDDTWVDQWVFTVGADAPMPGELSELRLSLPVTDGEGEQVTAEDHPVIWAIRRAAVDALGGRIAQVVDRVGSERAELEAELPGVQAEFDAATEGAGA